MELKKQQKREQEHQIEKARVTRIQQEETKNLLEQREDYLERERTEEKEQPKSEQKIFNTKQTDGEDLKPQEMDESY